jgi:DNA-binding response OmpR family regulator
VRVLVIEDDQEVAETVAVGLRRARMAVDITLDGPDGLTHALDYDYDVIVLDRDLPGIHDDDICANLVAAGEQSLRRHRRQRPRGRLSQLSHR